MNILKYILLVIIIASIYLGCTDNPFFEDADFVSDKLVIKGTVELDRSDDRSGVYVWLEGLNVSTYTNSNGQFELHLPSPAALSGGATAWNGKFKLYYYLVNYRPDTSAIVIRNGKVEFGKLDVDHSGSISRKIILKEILGIRTTINPTSTDKNVIFGQRVDLTFTNYGERVRIFTYVPFNASSGCVIFRRLDGQMAHTRFVLANLNSLERLFITQTEVWHMRLGDTNEMGVKDMDPISIEPGLYEVVPYVLIEQDGVPEELLESITPHYRTFSAEYLKLPFKWDVDTFEVK
jgi:hypothetical protein